MSRTTVTTPDQSLLDAELLTIAGASAKRQTVESCPPRAIIQATLTLPAGAAVYAAGDAMTDSAASPTALTFANAARYNGGGGIIKGVTILDSANQATKLSAELWLFRGSAAPTPDNDNAPFTPTDAELANLLGVIVFDGPTAGWSYIGDATVGAGGNVILVGRIGPSGAGAHLLDLPYKCHSSIANLFGLMVARNAYTPVASEAFTISLDVEQE